MMPLRTFALSLPWIALAGCAELQGVVPDEWNLTPRAAAPKVSEPADEVPEGDSIAIRRRPGFEPDSAMYTNTGVRRPADYFGSPYKDIQVAGNGEPKFYDRPRDLWAIGYEPVRWLVNVVGSPLSFAVRPYWIHETDYGPIDPSLPAPPTELVTEPTKVEVNQ